MSVKIQYLVAAKDQFEHAQSHLVLAARAIEKSELPLPSTMKELKENIGDLALVVDMMNDFIEEHRVKQAFTEKTQKEQP